MSLYKTTVSYNVPTAGATIILPAFDSMELMVFLNPTGILATITINLPSVITDGQKVSLMTSQAITLVTMGGGTILSALTTMGINAFATYSFSATANQWFRLN